MLLKCIVLNKKKTWAILLVKHIFSCVDSNNIAGKTYLILCRCICLRDNDADSIDVAAALSHYWWKMSPMMCNTSHKCIFHRSGPVVCFEMWIMELDHNSTPMILVVFQLILSRPSPDNWRQTNIKWKKLLNQNFRKLFPITIFLWGVLKHKVFNLIISATIWFE